MLYDVTIKVRGYYRTIVDAPDMRSAEAEAVDRYGDADFGVLDDIDAEVSDIERAEAEE